MDTTYDMLNDAAQIVYIRAVRVKDLPEDVQQQAEGLDELYAVCDINGERLALVKDREMAFVLARQNDMAPVTVH